jgi:hypothetical protein
LIYKPFHVNLSLENRIYLSASQADRKTYQADPEWDMKSEDKALQIRRKPDFRSFMEEIKFLKSLTDVKYLFQKAAFLLPRIAGSVDRWTDVPSSILIEPTLYCNLDCTTCCLSKSVRAPGSMDFA